MKGRQINTFGATLYFTRHAQSIANTGHESINTPLSPTGVEQATKLDGHYNCVIISPLQRCISTLENSSITYDYLHISYNFREMVFSSSDCLNEDEISLYKDGVSISVKDEDNVKEKWDTFNTRMNAFQIELESLCTQYKKILLIGHAFYFNAWYRQGCFPVPKNAEIIKLET